MRKDTLSTLFNELWTLFKNVATIDHGHNPKGHSAFPLHFMNRKLHHSYANIIIQYNVVGLEV